MKISKKLIALCFAVITVLFVTIPTSAEVYTTKEHTNGITVYVAGNTDFYPVEYYDEEAEAYKGLFPELFKDISETSGIDFSYIDAKSKDRQELCRNKQVDVVSAFVDDEIKDVAGKVAVFTYKDGEKTHTVYLGFTDIADKNVIDAVTAAFTAKSENYWLSKTLLFTTEPQTHMPLWSYFVMGGVVLAVIVLIVLLIREKRAGRNKIDDQLDVLTGIGNDKYMRNTYDHFISDASRSLYYFTYISFDVQRCEEYFGTSRAEDLQLYAAATINEATADTDFAARISNGVFLFCFEASNDETAELRLKEIIDKIRNYELASYSESFNFFRAGVYHLDVEKAAYEIAVSNAKAGYLCAVKEKKDIVFSTKELLKEESLQNRLKEKLSTAIDRGEFEIHVQFIYNTEQQRFSGGEVLSRWKNPQDGLLSPAYYIENMIKLGIIDKHDFYILDKTCQVLDKLKKNGINDFRLSCNFTRMTISSENFIARLREIVKKYDFDYNNLVFEITEDSLVDNQTITYRNILDCQTAGFRIALDDLGNGFSSFKDLCDYPIDLVKVDRHIISKAVTDRGFALIKGLSHLAEELDIELLFEGVETEEENEILSRCTCTYIQGYYYSHVFPLNQAMDYYRSHPEKFKSEVAVKQ